MSSNLAELIEALRSDDAAARETAAEKLAGMSAGARGAAVPLVEICQRDEPTREWAVAALEGLGPPDERDIGPLVELLKSPALDAAYWAATLLGRIGARAAGAVAALVEALDSHGDMAVRQRAAWALGQIGPSAAAARASLEAAAAGSDRRLALLAGESLAQIDG